MFIAYKNNPHPATVVTPYEALYGRPKLTRLDHEAGAKLTKPGEASKLINETRNTGGACHNREEMSMYC